MYANTAHNKTFESVFIGSMLVVNMKTYVKIDVWHKISIKLLMFILRYMLIIFNIIQDTPRLHTQIKLYKYYIYKYVVRMLYNTIISVYLNYYVT